MYSLFAAVRTPYIFDVPSLRARKIHPMAARCDSMLRLLGVVKSRLASTLRRSSNFSLFKDATSKKKFSPAARGKGWGGHPPKPPRRSFAARRAQRVHVVLLCFFLFLL